MGDKLVMRGAGRGRRPLMHTVAAAALALICTGCTPAKVRFQPGEIPPGRPMTATEYQQGAQLRDALVQQSSIADEPRYTRRVEFVLRRLLAVAPNAEHWQVYILPVPEWNAMTTPGNFIYVYTGLLDELQDDDEVAAVLAHELGHRLALHHDPSIDELLGELTVALAQASVEAAVEQRGGAPSEAQGAGELAGTLMKGFAVNPYSQAKETEADLIGLFLMADAGFHPAKAVHVWETQARKAQEPPKFFSTHPPSAERQAFLATYVPQAESRYRRALASSAEENRPARPVQGAEPPLSPAAQQVVDEAGQMMAQYRFAEARQRLETFLRVEPRNSTAWELLGVVEAKERHLDRSERSLRKAVSLAPADGSARYNLACVQSLTGRNAEALVSLREAFSLSPQLRETAGEDPDLYPLKSDPGFAQLVAAPERGGATFTINE